MQITSGSSLKEKISSDKSANVLISNLKVSPIITIKFQFLVQKNYTPFLVANENSLSSNILVNSISLTPLKDPIFF
jgi:hypothetical protein